MADDNLVLVVGSYPLAGDAADDFQTLKDGREAGDYDAYLSELETALERRPDHPGALFHVAIAEALVGRDDDAVEHLRRALELRPELAEHARVEEDFAALRERGDWPL